MIARFRAFVGREQGEAGFTIIEVGVALAIFAIIIVGVAGSSSSSLRLVTKSSGRQSATQVAVQEMERLRGTPYAALGMSTSPLVQTAAPDPDSAVTADGLSYLVPNGSVTPELLVVGGAVAHGPTAGTDNRFRFQMYRYVTWVDDPATATPTDFNYKRATIVLTWLNADGGDPNRFVLSSLFSPGSVTWTSTTVATTTTTSTTTTTTTIAPSPPPACSASDNTPPTGTIAILAGTGALTGYTNQSSVQLQLSGSDTCSVAADLKVLLSNDGVTYSENAYTTSFTGFVLAAGDGARTAWVKYKDQKGNVSGPAQATIRVDSQKPSIPKNFKVKRLPSSQTTATLDWQASSDNDTLVGYRIYRQIGTAAFTALATVSASCGASCAYVDSPLDGSVSYTYYMQAYDAAGNESDATASVAV